MTNASSHTGMELDELDSALPVGTSLAEAAARSDSGLHSAVDLQAVFDVPVRVQAVLGKSTMEVSQLLKLAPGAVIELDRRVGEAIDIYVNNRLVARGEVVLVDEHLGVTMTEIVKQDRAA
jgi:flagellar motor switch protein FliN